MTEDVLAEADIVIRTPGLSEEEIAAVVAVVRGRIREECAARDSGADARDTASRRWREALAVGSAATAGLREWR